MHSSKFESHPAFHFRAATHCVLCSTQSTRFGSKQPENGTSNSFTRARVHVSACERNEPVQSMQMRERCEQPSRQVTQYLWSKWAIEKRILSTLALLRFFTIDQIIRFSLIGSLGASKDLSEWASRPIKLENEPVTAGCPELYSGPKISNWYPHLSWNSKFQTVEVK